MRNLLGIGKNSIHELKLKINRSLTSKPQRISEIAKTIGDVDQNQLSDVLNAMRTEGNVFCKGHGMGAKWQLSRPY